LLAAIALLAAAIVLIPKLGDDSGNAHGGDQKQNGGAAQSDAGTIAGGADTIAADWETYTDPAVGYKIAYPPGWSISTESTLTNFTDPETGTYLRVDWTDAPGPSPVGAWEDQSASFGAEHDNYEELRIEPTTYQGYDAAEWEYTYSEGDSDLHAIDLGFVTGDYGFALNFQTHEEDWTTSQAIFEAFKASFEVPE
jgi:hypothetical protein